MGRAAGDRQPAMGRRWTTAACWRVGAVLQGGVAAARPRKKEKKARIKDTRGAIKDRFHDTMITASLSLLIPPALLFHPPTLTSRWAGGGPLRSDRLPCSHLCVGLARESPPSSAAASK